MKVTRRSKRFKDSPLDGSTIDSKRIKLQSPTFDKENDVVFQKKYAEENENLQIKKEIEEKVFMKDEESDTEQDLGDGVTPYEKLIQKNKQANQDFLSNLGIFQAKEDLLRSAEKPKVKPSQRGIKREKSPPPPRRSSLRLMRKDPTGETLPDIPEPTPVIDEHERPPSGPLQMSDYLYGATQITHSDTFSQKIQSVGEQEACDIKSDSNLDSFIKSLSKLKLTDDQVAKVVPDRIFSVAIHPTRSKVIVAAGGKWGTVGVWDVEDVADELNGVVTYSPHSRPVGHLTFSTWHQDKLFSCSYDGSLRCAHFEKGVFDEIYSVDRDEYTLLRTFEFLSSDTLLVSQSDGCVAVVDTRTSGNESSNVYRVKEKSLRCVSIHPVNNNYFLTACSNGDATVFDQRMLKTGKKLNSNVAEVHHPKTISSAYFSPVTGKYILTTSTDDKLRIYDSSNLSSEIPICRSIRHNNFTGRWLTPFRAAWHPSREDVFVVGSMDRPRRIELYETTGQLAHALTNPDYLGSVCSLNVVHPTRDIVVGGNSSGRLHVFM